MVERVVAAIFNKMERRADTCREIQSRLVACERVAVAEHDFTRRAVTGFRIECVSEFSARPLYLQYLAISGAEVRGHFREMFADGLKRKIDSA